MAGAAPGIKWKVGACQERCALKVAFIAYLNSHEKPRQRDHDVIYFVHWHH